MAKTFSLEELDKLSAPQGDQEKSAKVVIPISSLDGPETQVQTPETSKTFSAVSGLGQGSTFGFGDELAGVTGAIWDIGFDKIMGQKSKPFIERYREARDFARQLNKKAQEANPKSYLAGELTGAIASSAPLGASAGTIKGGAGLGAAYSLGGSEADLTRPDLSAYKEALAETAKGAALGGGTAGAIKALGPTAKWFGGKLAQMAEGKAAKAVGITKPTAAKMGAEKVRELGRTALDEGIVGAPTRNASEDMLMRAEALREKGGKAMEAIYNKIDDANLSEFSPEEVAQAFKNKEGGFYASPANRDVSGQFSNVLESIQMRGENLPLREAQALKQEMGKLSQWKSLAPSEKAQMARSAYGIINKAIDAEAKRAGAQLGDDVLSQLQKAKKAYGFGAEMAGTEGKVGLLENKIAGEQASRGGIGLGNILFGGGGAVLGGAGGGPVGSFIGAAKGLALKKGIETFTKPSTQAWTLNKLSKLLQVSPQSFGKYATTLQSAAQRGPAAVSAVNHVLQQQDPEYRDMMRKMTEQEEMRQ